MEPIAIYKLIILYMLDRAGGELTMPRISSFLLEGGYSNFDNLTRTYDEIERNGFVSQQKRGANLFLVITAEGEDTLGFFSDQLSDEIKQQVRVYLKELGREIANEEAILGEYYRSTYGDYTVHLVIRERVQMMSEQSQPILSVDIAVADEEAAKEAVRNWTDRSGDIYRMLLEKLL